MLTVRRSTLAGLAAQVLLLGAVAATAGLPLAGWVVGLACAVTLTILVVRGRSRSGAQTLGPADLVTLTRASVACTVAAVTTGWPYTQAQRTAVVVLATVALALDAVDGIVARRTGTVSGFGARFDGEADAFLILVLSVFVSHSVGAWVLAIGLARYAFLAAGWVVPWLRRPLPPRRWRKVVAALQGVVLTAAAAQLAPPAVSYAALLAALALLAASFGECVWWLWRHRYAGLERDRREAPAESSALGRRPGRHPSRRPMRHPRVRAALRTVTSVVAVLVVWLALVAPDDRLAPTAFLRLPVEGLVVVALALSLPTAGRRVLVGVAGALLGVLTLAKGLDVGFVGALDRRFNPVTDRSYLGPALAVVRDSVGEAGAVAAAVGVAGLALLVVVGVPLALGRVVRLASRRRRRSLVTIVVLGIAWVALAVSGLQVGTDGAPVASTDTARLAVGEVRTVAATVRDQQRFDRAAAAADPFQDPEVGNLSALRGKDVLLVFVESYGRVAVQGASASPQVRAVLDDGTRQLAAKGFESRSAFLTSPTFGGISWLAHSTLQSGLWVDNQTSYDKLMAGHRLTLTSAFQRSGWRTVALMPSNGADWPSGGIFYRFDTIYDRRNLGYAGPPFGFSAMPDQFALAAFQRLELATPHAPLMVEVDLASSHGPWAPVPRLVDWDTLGNGSVFDRMHDQVESAQQLLRNRADVPAAYMASIAYSMQTLVSFVEKYGNDNLVVVLLGDHQPAPIVSGSGAGHDVPITVLAHDPSVIDRMSGWGWEPGLRPDAAAPVWPMDAFRNRFLAAYSTPPGDAVAAGASGPGH